MKVKIWLTSWLVIVISSLSACEYLVFTIDPFMHYRKPDLDRYFYRLDNQRSQNDGIIKHFDYDAMITGTSMTENFRTTEADRLFGCHFIKTSFSGGLYKEINDNIKNAFKENPDLKTVIRCLDIRLFDTVKDEGRDDLGRYPTYLYDSNPFNDVEYLLNRDVVFERSLEMTLEKDKEGFEPGITSFDDYSRWQERYTFGSKTVLQDGAKTEDPAQTHLSDDVKQIIRENIAQNVTNLADEHPEIDFYYYYSPYSAAVWDKWKRKGTLYEHLEAVRYVTELILPHKNIHLFSFNGRTDIITDLNNYKDETHYACWVNSLILKWIHDGKYQLTEDNYKERLKQEYDFFTTFDYSGLYDQEDYEADYYAGALLNQELTGIKPLDVLHDKKAGAVISGAEYRSDENDQPVVDCRGSLSREPEGENLAYYLREKEYIGIRFDVNLDKGYNYLAFDGQKIAGRGCLTAFIYDSRGKLLKKAEANDKDLDHKVHQYVIDLSVFSGNVTVILNGGYVDHTGGADPEYQFSNIFMY